MATITAGDFRNGKTFEMDGKIMQVVEFQHVKPGKGAAFVRTKMKNIVTGAVTETSFNPTAKFEEAFIERKDAEYSYNDGDLYYFMDQETYDMIPIGKETLDDSFRFIKENTMCKPVSYTHLDVYKRQRCSSVSRMQTAFCSYQLSTIESGSSLTVQPKASASASAIWMAL